MATVIGQFMRNIVTSWASMIISLAITFFFTPYLIDMLGKERYGIWSLAFSIVAYLGLVDLGVRQLRGALNIISVPPVPAVSRMEAGKDYDRIVSFYNEAARYLYYLSGYLCFAVPFLGGPFILLWVGEDFRPAIRILQVLIIVGGIYFPQAIANSVLFGLSRHKIAYSILVSEATSKIILSLRSLKTYGIFGVAMGTAIPQVTIYSFIYPAIFYRTMNTSVSIFYKGAIRSILLAAISILSPAFLMRHLAFPDSSNKLLAGELL